MDWPCAKNGSYSAYKNRTDMDSRETKEKGVPRTTGRRTVMKEMRRVAIDWERAARLAQDRVFWKGLFEDLRATGHHRIERVSE